MSKVIEVLYNINKDINGLTFNSHRHLIDYKSSLIDNERNPEVWYDNTYYLKYDFILGI